jgi:hypothetical protein
MAKGGPEKPNSKMWGACDPASRHERLPQGHRPQKTMERWDQSFGTFLKSMKTGQ